MARVLIVDDDKAVCQSLALVLGGLGHEVEYRLDGLSALDRLGADSREGPGAVECAIVDVMMPGPDGFEVCRQIRARSMLPIIMLTARSEAVDVIVGLECGADDYVVKPVDPRVLDARIKAVLRRSGQQPGSTNEVMVFGSITVDPSAMTVTRNGHGVELTPTELRLLLELAAHPGQVLTRQVLLDRVWDYGFLGDSRIVDGCVQRLRAKIEDDPTRPTLITTVRAVGYRMNKP